MKVAFVAPANGNTAGAVRERTELTLLAGRGYLQVFDSDNGQLLRSTCLVNGEAPPVGSDDAEEALDDSMECIETNPDPDDEEEPRNAQARLLLPHLPKCDGTSALPHVIATNPAIR